MDKKNGDAPKNGNGTPTPDMAAKIKAVVETNPPEPPNNMRPVKFSKKTSDALKEIAEPDGPTVCACCGHKTEPPRNKAGQDGPSISEQDIEKICQRISATGGCEARSAAIAVGIKAGTWDTWHVKAMRDVRNGVESAYTESSRRFTRAREEAKNLAFVTLDRLSQDVTDNEIVEKFDKDGNLIQRTTRPRRSRGSAIAAIAHVEKLWPKEFGRVVKVQHTMIDSAAVDAAAKRAGLTRQQFIDEYRETFGKELTIVETPAGEVN